MTYLILFLAPFLSGLLIYVIPKDKLANYKLLLVFAGSYLFSITVTHILPELYKQHEGLRWIGVFVLIGFFLQQVLEYFSSGIEHGHLPSDHAHDHQHDHSHPHDHDHSLKVPSFVLLFALSIHAFLEGGMLAQPDAHTHSYNVSAVLIGIVLHRAPAAFALMTLMAFQLKSRSKATPYLLIFSLAAPIGLFISNYLADHQIIGESGLIYLYALVCGNFLHISTTIVFESSPGHSFNSRKLLVAMGGALVAVGVEILL